MRIIAGSAGGRRLVAPATSDTRPATDRVREAVFSSIGSQVIDAAVVDLYAGSGAFGLEALSRGADSAVFVEQARKALEALTKNIASLELGGSVVRGTVRKFLEATELRFDLAFVDPPWPMSTDLLSADFGALDRTLDPGAMVVASRRHSDRVPSAPESWRVAADKRYGDTRILRYEKEAEKR